MYTAIPCLGGSVMEWRHEGERGPDVAVKMLDLNKWEMITRSCLSKEYFF